MRKITALITLVFVIASLGLGTIGASAESYPAVSDETLSSDNLSASPIVESVEYRVSKTSCSVRVTLTNYYPGTIKAVIEQQSGSSWTTYQILCEERFSPTYEVYRSLSTNLPSGTYRINLLVTAEATSYSATSGNYVIS